MELAMKPGNGECCLYPIRHVLVALILLLRPGPAKIPSGDAGHVTSWQASVCQTKTTDLFPESLTSFPLSTLADLCADCKTRNPRWASHNLGIFIWYIICLYLLGDTHSV
jgi:hypothetical protein